MGCAASSTTIAETALQPSQTNFFDEYALGMKLGRGAFAQVRIAAKVIPGSQKRDVAVKILDLRDKIKANQTSSVLVQKARSEAAIWSSAKNHENVVCIHEAFFDEDVCFFVMELCAKSLFAHLESMPELNERSIGSILAQMFAGLSHVHSVRVVHRDVKPDNFLVGGEAGTTVKLCDFGLSATLPKSCKVKGAYGTAPFMCPEMLQGMFYDETADVWSMAVLAYCFFFGEFPYVPKRKNTAAMKLSIVDGMPPSFEPVAPCLGQLRSKSAVDFIHALLERKPEQRPSARDALKMPFMVAVAQNHDLPSLRPMIYAAKKAGAFEIRDPMMPALIDPLLNTKHQKKHGLPLLDQSFTWCAKSVLGKTSEARETSKSWQIATSGTSFNSTIWGNSSSFATTASGHSSPSGSFAHFESSPKGSSSGTRNMHKAMH